MKKILFPLLFFVANTTEAQRVGVGTATPSEKLHVVGTLKTYGMKIQNGGNNGDFISQSNATGTVGHKKAHGGFGVNYIICMQGIYPQPSGPNLTNGPIVGEIVAFTGDFAPANWRMCHGQVLVIDSFTALYSLIGTTYGDGGTDSTFQLPDLRGLVPVGVGTSQAGYIWNRGQKSN